MDYHVISLREQPDMLNAFVDYFAEKWGKRKIYDDSMSHCIASGSPLPQWYVLVDADEKIVGCSGLVANDFNSRQDLWPWLCAVHISEEERGQGLGEILIAHAVEETKRLGFDNLYLGTDHIGYYEKYGWTYLENCFGADGDPARIYWVEAQKGKEEGIERES